MAHHDRGKRYYVVHALKVNWNAAARHPKKRFVKEVSAFPAVLAGFALDNPGG
jgi:hypothetical protein